LGWHCDIVGRMLSNYHQFSLDEILYEMPLIDVYVLYSWAYFNSPINQFNGIQMTNSYTAQESDNLLVELKEMKSKQGTK
jgi:hypothetical protein